MRYNVNLTVMAPISCTIEVEADDEDGAVEEAIEAVVSDRKYRIPDFDGNYVEITEGDVTIDDVEEA